MSRSRKDLRLARRTVALDHPRRPMPVPSRVPAAPSCIARRPSARAVAIAWLFLGLSLGAALYGLPVRAQPSAPLVTDAHTAAAYDSLLTRLKGGDTAIDYARFRIAYTQTAAYDPYGWAQRTQRDRAAAAWERGDLASARQTLDSLFAVNYVDMRAHALAMLVAGDAGDAERMRHHMRVVEGLVRSIGPALSERGAEKVLRLVVISTDEEYFYTRAHGLERRMRSYGTCEGVPCDIMEVFDPETEETFALVFDLSLLKAHRPALGDERG